MGGLSGPSPGLVYVGQRCGGVWAGCARHGGGAEGPQGATEPSPRRRRGWLERDWRNPSGLAGTGTCGGREGVGWEGGWWPCPARCQGKAEPQGRRERPKAAERPAGMSTGRGTG